MASGEDRISILPEEALLQVMYLLPAHDAVRTSVLARRWRHLWKSVPRLLIVQKDRFDTIDEMNKFVSRLLLLRDHSSALEECQFEVDSFFDDDCKHVDLWLRQALCCQVRSLRFYSRQLYRLPVLADAPLISQRLTKLDLDSVQLKGCFLDFSSCPELEDVKMVSCAMETNKITSKSLKRLSMADTDFDLDDRARISAPSLVSLEISDPGSGLNPVLENMPSLVSAFVRIGVSCWDYFEQDDDDIGDPVVLLKGLSDATHLELTTKSEERFPPSQCVFIRDLRWCPTFSNLKTLLLNEWCLAGKFSVLICFLQHSPVLENLTLQICEFVKYITDAEGIDIQKEQCFASKHLKIVEIKYNEISGIVHEVVKVLNSCGVPLGQINVQKWVSPSSFRNQRR